MHGTLVHARRWAVSAAAAFVMLWLPTIGHAQTITLCINVKTGKIVSIGGPCGGSQVELDFDMNGITGPAGPTGPQGSAGVPGVIGLQGGQGPQGAAGSTWSGWRHRSQRGHWSERPDWTSGSGWV